MFYLREVLWSQNILEKSRDIHTCPCVCILFLIISTGVPHLLQLMSSHCHLGSIVHIRNRFWCAFTELQLMFMIGTHCCSNMYMPPPLITGEKPLIFCCPHNFAFFQNGIWLKSYSQIGIFHLIICILSPHHFLSLSDNFFNTS